MTATVHRDPPSLSLPQTQNTAPVLEFTCLYTHDLKRKQKRWQDGFLRYHTFNKRIMVYDVPRNFIGDTHWTAGEALQDGDEVMLDKDGVLVQVEESVGRTETDLTELRKSAKHGSSEHGSSSPAHVARTPTSRPAVSRPVTAQGGKAPMQLRHRSLNTLLGTPKGPIGKATLPATSPFELRGNNSENAGWADGRPPKRQRLGGSWKAQRTTSAFEDPKHNERRAVQKKSAQRRQQKPPAKEIVDLSRDEDEPHEFLPDFTSDMIQPPSSPPRRVGLAESPLLARSSSPAFQTQKLPNSMSRNSANSQHARGEDPQAESRVTTARNAETPPQMPKQGMRGGPGLQTSDEQMQNPKLQRQRSMHATAILDASDHKTGQALRMPASSSKKKTLLCQEQLSNKPKRTSSANIDIAANVSLDAVSDGEVEAAADDPQRKLRARLARINKKYVLQPQTRTNLAVTDRGTDVQSVSAGRQSHREDDADVENPRMQTSFRSSELESCQTDAILVPSSMDEAEAENSNNMSNRVHVQGKRTPQGDPHSPSKQTGSKKKGVNRKEIRKSAESCFQKPINEIVPGQEESKTHDQSPPPRQENGTFRRIVSESFAPPDALLPQRIPGAPMKFTPSPTKQSSPGLTH